MNERRTTWPEMHQYMTNKGFESMPPKVANELVQSGEWVVVDVRPASRFAEAHPTGAVNVELYQEVAHLERGIYGWHLDGLPFDGRYKSAGVGRTPSVVEVQIFSYGRETHIIEPSDMTDMQPRDAAL